jgi:EAL domain-containing protein (putative c-di-GMP-specific phosphodiesterase class I)/AmiR/NasT family two-component response regulator
VKRRPQVREGRAVHDKLDAEIVLLDDDTVMLALLKWMLAELGYRRVHAFSSAVAVLEAIDRRTCVPKLIVFDLGMPGIDGIELISHLVGRDYAGSVAVVSGADSSVLRAAQSLARAHRIAVLGAIPKPASRDSLAALLDTWEPVASRRTKRTGTAYGFDEVRRAIVNHELVNHYQPKVDVATGRLVGVEALVRWQHPEDGMVFPDAFVGVAEDHGLIDRLTTLVLQAAVGQARRWRDDGLDLEVAINVSMDNLTSADFPDVVAREAAAAGIAPADLRLEVTESRLMHDLRVPLQVLARLRLKGFGLAIDDFGTGHSSLAQLRDFPFNEIKIDRGFVHGACANPTLRAIYDASLNLGLRLGMKVVAEGVEDWDDWNFLRETGCTLAQGYFVAKPMPAQGLPAWSADWADRVDEFNAV